MKRIVALVALSGIALVLLLVGLAIRHGHRDVEEAKIFCESLIPQIQSYYSEHGEYPSEIDPNWLTGLDVPALIDVKTFYLKSSGKYLLRFRSPVEFWDDVFGYHGGPDGGAWLQYDGY